MPAAFPKFRSLLRDLVEKTAAIFIGEPARIVRKSTLDRLERLAYRQQLRDAVRDANNEFVEREIRKNQLTESDLARLAQKHTPIEQWSELPEYIMSPTLFDGASEQTHAIAD